MSSIHSGYVLRVALCTAATRKLTEELRTDLGTETRLSDAMNPN